jgi:hypothetical protein
MPTLPVPAVTGSLPPNLPATETQNFPSSVTLTGWFGGVGRWLTGSRVTTTTINGDAEITLDPQNNRVQADFSSFQVGGNGRRHQSGRAQFGSLDLSRPANSSYRRFDRFSASGKGTINGVPFSGRMSNVTRTTAAPLGAALRASDLTICECEYTRWGVWEAKATHQHGYARSEKLVGTWVAGRPTTIAEVPTVGQATYIGHVVANVQNGSLDNMRYPENVSGSRLVAGNFTNTVDFGARTGSVTVTGLDQTNYAGTVRFMNDPRQFAGSLTGDYGYRKMGLSGGFFRGTASPVGEMGGSVMLSGHNYLGTGTFAARMK